MASITRTWDVMHFAPPLVITKEEVDRMVADRPTRP